METTVMTEEMGMEEIVKKYNQDLFKLNEVVNFEIENALLTAKVLGVNSNGELILNTGKEIAIPIGRVSWLLTS